MVPGREFQTRGATHAFLDTCCLCAGIRYVPDTDDEFYNNGESDDSDASVDSNASTKDDKSAVASATQSSGAQLKRRLSDADEQLNTDNKTAVRSKDVDTDAVEVKRLGDGRKQLQLGGDCEAVDRKRRKLDDDGNEPAANINSHGLYETSNCRR